MKIKEQIHYVNPKYAGSKIETVKMKELFSDYKENPEQIIRLNTQVYKKAYYKLLFGELHLFNLVDNVNKEIITNFHKKKKENNYALITEIYGNEGIIKESSIKVVEILEIGNYYLQQIYKNKLYQNGINNFKNLKDLLDWLTQEFYKGNISIEEILKTKQLFFRQITL